MLSARQVSEMIGPDTPDCDCTGCQMLRRVRAAISEPITALEETMIAEEVAAGATDEDICLWLGVLAVAAGRARAMGAAHLDVMGAVAHGAIQAAKQNALLLAEPEGETWQ